MVRLPLQFYRCYICAGGTRLNVSLLASINFTREKQPPNIPFIQYACFGAAWVSDDEILYLIWYICW